MFEFKLKQIVKTSKIPYKHLVNTLYKFKKELLPFISLNFYTKNVYKYGQKKKQFTSKHYMFGAINLCQAKAFTQPLVLIVETFKRSDLPYCSLIKHSFFYH